MITIGRSRNSCGILEVDSMSGLEPKIILRQLYKIMRGSGREWNYKGAFITFTDAVRYETVRELRDYMTEEKFKNLTYLNEATNPNSGNVIGVLIWQFDAKKLTAWNKKYLKDLPKQVVRKFKVLKDHCSHRAPIGSIVTMRYDDDGAELLRGSFAFYFEEVRGNMIHFDEVEEIVEEVKKEVEKKVEKVEPKKIFTWR